MSKLQYIDQNSVCAIHRSGLSMSKLQYVDHTQYVSDSVCLSYNTSVRLSMSKLNTSVRLSMSKLQYIGQTQYV